LHSGRLKQCLQIGLNVEKDGLQRVEVQIEQNSNELAFILPKKGNKAGMHD